jgi:hypothetical protein
MANRVQHKAVRRRRCGKRSVVSVSSSPHIYVAMHTHWHAGTQTVGAGTRGSFSETWIATDRRRLGRVQTDKFRNATAVKATFEATTRDQIASPASVPADEHDPRAIARGVVVGLPIGIALWATIGVATWYLL